MRKTIVIGTRGSRLALIQTGAMVAQIKKIEPHIEINICKVMTSGDRDRRTALGQIPGIGIFVKELEEALLDGRIDLAVHSLKDMPTDIPQRLHLAAVTARLDPRDVLVSRDRQLAQLAPGSKIGTGSFRRTIQLAACRQDLNIHSIRGNIDTRLRKVSSGEFDGVILAAAAMIRLERQGDITEYLPVEHFLPAVGQGALGIEARLEDKDMIELASRLNHLPTWQSTAAERAFLRALGGGCRAPIAALGIVRNGKLKLEGMAADASGKKMLRSAEEGDVSTPQQVGINLAKKMLAMGASEFLTEAKGR